MSKLLKLSIALVLQLSFQQVFGQSLTPLKIAELASHRIERLVLLKKIDANFENQFQQMYVDVLNDSAEANYKITIYQNAPEMGVAPLSIDLFADVSGKIVKYLVNEGGAPGPIVNWTGKGPVTLVENALHYVLDESSSDATLRPYDMDFSSLAIHQKLINGETVAEVTLHSKSVAEVLVLTLNLNGKIKGKEIR